MHRIDGAGATANNRFTEGNPTTGTPATAVTADFMNALQDELVAVIAEAGLALNKADNSQLRQAILSLTAGGGAAVTASGVSIVDGGEYFAAGDVESALQQLAAKIYAGTVAANQVRRTVVAASGASHQTQAAHAENIVEVSHSASATYTVRPDSELNLPVGTAITVVQAGAGPVAFVQGSGVTIKKPAAFNRATFGQEASAVLYKVGANAWRLGGMLEAA